MKNKVLIELLVPEIEEKYDLFIPINKKIGTIIMLLQKSIFELSDGIYVPSNHAFIYNSLTNEKYDLNKKVKETDIRNGSIIILM